MSILVTKETLGIPTHRDKYQFKKQNNVVWRKAHYDKKLTNFTHDQ